MFPMFAILVVSSLIVATTAISSTNIVANAQDGDLGDVRRLCEDATSVLTPFPEGSGLPECPPPDCPEGQVCPFPSIPDIRNERLSRCIAELTEVDFADPAGFCGELLREIISVES